MKRVLLALLLLPSIALAQSHPADMTKIITNPQGAVVPDPTAMAADSKDCSKCPPLTVGGAVAIALNGTYEDEKSLGWQQRYDRAVLAKKLRDDPAAVVDGTELGVIERLMGKAGFSGWLLMEVIDDIDPNAKSGKVQ